MKTYSAIILGFMVLNCFASPTDDSCIQEFATLAGFAETLVTPKFALTKVATTKTIVAAEKKLTDAYAELLSGNATTINGERFVQFYTLFYTFSFYSFGPSKKANANEQTVRKQYEAALEYFLQQDLHQPAPAGEKETLRTFLGFKVVTREGVMESVNVFETDSENYASLLKVMQDFMKAKRESQLLRNQKK